MDAWDRVIYVTPEMQNLGKLLLNYNLCILGERAVQVAIGEKPHYVKGEMFAFGTWLDKAMLFAPNEATIYKIQRELQSRV